MSPLGLNAMFTAIGVSAGAMFVLRIAASTFDLLGV